MLKFLGFIFWLDGVRYQSFTQNNFKCDDLISTHKVIRHDISIFLNLFFHLKMANESDSKLQWYTDILFYILFFCCFFQDVLVSNFSRNSNSRKVWVRMMAFFCPYFLFFFPYFFNRNCQNLMGAASLLNAYVWSGLWIQLSTINIS